MFDFFTRRTAKDYLTEAKETYGVPEVKPISVPAPTVKEHYRVGADDQGNTTLTFIADSGYSMTLTMNQQETERMIRMLRATYNEQTKETKE